MGWTLCGAQASWAGRRVRVNYAFWWPVFLLFNGLNYHSWERFDGLVESQVWVVLALGALNATVLVGALALGEGLLADRAWRRLVVAAYEEEPGGRANESGQGRRLAVSTLLGWVSAVLAAVPVLGYATDSWLFGHLGVHVVTGLRLLWGSGWDQCRVIVESTGLRAPVAVGVLAAGAGVGIAGTIIVRFTRFLSNRSPLHVRFGCGLLTLAGLVVLLAVLEGWGTRLDSRARIWQEQRRVLPFTLSFQERGGGLALDRARLSPLRSAAEAEGALPLVVPRSPGRLPDIFLFVVESLRGDILDACTTPNLTELRHECFAFGESLAASNATETSWYGLFTANYALYAAAAAREPATWGSASLKQLRRLGYSVHVLASSHLDYRNMDQVIFGSGHQLADSFLDIRDFGGAEAPERDREIMRRLIEQIGRGCGGRLFLVFYESTHHDYSWPEDAPAPFQPVASPWNFYLNFRVSPQELVGIKNRYRNAVLFVDSLVGQVVSRLRSEGRYNESVLLVTGDHGEEFLEHGRLVHANETCRVQTHVPILLKPARDMARPPASALARTTATHIDILPTMLDLLGANPQGPWAGESLLRKVTDDAVIVQENGSRDPWEFCVQAGGFKAWLHYPSSDTIVSLEHRIRLSKVTDASDSPVNRRLDTAEGRAWCRATFGSVLARIYPDLQW